MFSLVSERSTEMRLLNLLLTVAVALVVNKGIFRDFKRLSHIQSGPYITHPLYNALFFQKRGL